MLRFRFVFQIMVGGRFIVVLNNYGDALLKLITIKVMVNAKLVQSINSSNKTGMFNNFQFHFILHIQKDKQHLRYYSIVYRQWRS